MSRALSIVLLLVQFVPLALFPPAMVTAIPQVMTIPAFLTILALVATIATVAGSRAAWPRAMLIFAQGLNVVSRLMIMIVQAMPNAQTTNVPFILVNCLCIAISLVALYLFDQFQLNLRSA